MARLKESLYHQRLGAGFVLIALLLFVAISLKPINFTSLNGHHSFYTLYATFDRADGLVIGSDVRLAGIPVGKVTSLTLDSYYRSLVSFDLREDLLLPEDTSAIIETDGLFGSKYIDLEPGGLDDYLSDGTSIDTTQGSLVLEDLLERILSMARSRRTSSQTEQVNHGDSL